MAITMPNMPRTVAEQEYLRSELHYDGTFGLLAINIGKK